jgi:hypothetical protein
LSTSRASTDANRDTTATRRRAPSDLLAKRLRADG